MNISARAILKWTYWLFNHGDVRTTIENAIPELSEHLVSKWIYYSRFSNDTALIWLRWFCELDTNLQIRFAEWVSANYHGIDERLERIDDLDESGAGGLWDAAGTIAKTACRYMQSCGILSLDENDFLSADECGQEDIYYELKKL